MYLLRLTTLHFITTCYGLATYDLFQGFNKLDLEDEDNFNYTSPTNIVDELTSFLLTGDGPNKLTDTHKESKISADKSTSVNITTTTPLSNSVAKNSTRGTTLGTTYFSRTPTTVMPTTKTQPTFTDEHTIVEQAFNCPEEERPSNLGAYEIPTQRDLVYFTRAIMLRMFDNYHRKTLIFLKDIKEVMKSTANEERKCLGVRKIMYRQCVRQVSGEFEHHTKKLVNNLERQRRDVVVLTEGRICKMADMRADPVALMKSIAAEEVSLHYALPGFLRLLSSCSKYCELSDKTMLWKPEPKRRDETGTSIRTYMIGRNLKLHRTLNKRHKTIL